VEPRTYAVLAALAADDGQSQRQLSERLGIHRNAMVTAIDNLERQGLAKRLPNPDEPSRSRGDLDREGPPPAPGALDEQASSWKTRSPATADFPENATR